MYKTLNKAENDFLQHIGMWGSAAYPVRKTAGGKWLWHEFWGVKGAPVVYKTKKAAVEAIERYLDILRDKAAGRLPPSQDSEAALAA